MKVLLIAPSNTLVMPYLKNYKSIMDQLEIETFLICWDRLKIENKENNKFIFIDKKTGHKRGILDYLRYCNFIYNVFKKKHFDKIVIFGIQLTFFLQKYLKSKKGDFIVDIRDYHGLIKFINVPRILSDSYKVVLSSPAYRKWLPKSDKYVISHNTTSNKLHTLEYSLESKDKLNIGYIGSIANFKENSELIDSLKNNSGFLLEFHGLGTINQELLSYIKKFNIENVIVKGQYSKEDEENLYKNIDFVNLFLSPKNINNKTCLANRFYNAIIVGKPILMLEGTYMSELVKQYNLGLVVANFGELEYKLKKYVADFSENDYEEGRVNFYNKIQSDEEIFRNVLNDFLNSD